MGQQTAKLIKTTFEQAKENVVPLESSHHFSSIFWSHPMKRDEYSQLVTHNDLFDIKKHNSRNFYLLILNVIYNLKIFFKYLFLSYYH